MKSIFGDRHGRNLILDPDSAARAQICITVTGTFLVLSDLKFTTTCIVISVD